jgi:hypothetical protein
MNRLLSLTLFLLVAPVTTADDMLPVVFEEDFEKGADRWQPQDPAQ